MKNIIFLILLPLSASAADNGSVTFDKTRIIMNGNKEILLVTNNKPHPLLIKSTVYSEGNEKSTDFVATPPVFKSESTDRNIIKILRKNPRLPQDKEYLNWLCVDAIPPQEVASTTQRGKRSDAINITIRGCIKIINRPEGLKKPSFSTLSDNLKWSVNKNTITVKNDSPYYINFNNITVDNTENNTVVYLQPFSEAKIPLKYPPHTVTWSLIDDYGSETRTSKHIF